MGTIAQYSTYSQLSLAAYAEGLNTGETETLLVKAGFAQAQANQFITDGWEVISHGVPGTVYLTA